LKYDLIINLENRRGHTSLSLLSKSLLSLFTDPRIVGLVIGIILIKNLLKEKTMANTKIRDVSLFVKILGKGYPLSLMHGGPGVDHTTMLPLRACADEFKLIYYDHRCNGRSNNIDISTMTWENLTADADSLRDKLGFKRWAVLGHSFGGMVALEYALRYPGSLSHLILVDTCGDISWAQENAPKVLSSRGFDLETVELAKRFFIGNIEPREMKLAMRRFGKAYYHKPSLALLIREVISGFRMKVRTDALIFGFSRLLKNWTVMDRLNEIRVPTLIIAGRHDFQFPPEHQRSLANGISNALLKIIENAGHNAHSERPDIVTEEIKQFISR